MGFKARSAGSRQPGSEREGTRKREFDAALRHIIDDRTRMQRLLMLEKKRRRLAADKLVFVGTRNLAQYYWCAMQAVIKSRKRTEEEMFFSVYLQDRLRYSFELGLIQSLPEDDEALLHIGDAISLADMELLLQKRSKTYIEDNEPLDLDVRMDRLEAWEEEQGPKHPFWHGEEAEVFVAEEHPTIRWNFAWGDYAVIGIPDGIGKDFIYEFKMVGKTFFATFVRPVARAQANLYGYFYHRPRKRLHLLLRDERRLESEESPVDIGHAISTLTKFRAADAGEQPMPPRPWKCTSCPDDIKEQCPIRPG